MSPRATPLALTRLGAPLRRLALGGVSLGALGAALVALAIPAWLVRLGLIRSPVWVPLAWVALIGVLVLAVLVALRARRGLGDAPLARAVERGTGWRLGSVTSVLEGASAGTSDALFAAADDACAARLEAGGREALAPVRRRLVRGSKTGAGILGAGLLLFLGAGPLRHPAAALWAPARAWAMLMAPVQIAVDRASVDRGETVALSLRAAGRPDAELWLRGKGEAWRSLGVPLDSAGRAVRRIGPLEGDLYAFVRAGGRTSDTLLVRVRLPAFLGRISLTAHYPRYLSLDDEPLPATGDTLLLPAGTRIEAAGEATMDLSVARWAFGGATADLAVSGREFRGTFLPRQSGLATLELRTGDGAALEGDPVALPIVVVPDRPPVVALPVPEPDTMAVLGSEVSVVVDASDDHGLSAVALQATKGTGQGPVVSGPLALPPGTTDRALLSARFDLKPFSLQPGDTLSLWVVARDNAPTPQVGRSRTIVLVVPTAAEARVEQRSATADIAQQLDSLVDQAKSLQQSTEDLSQERRRANPRGEQAQSSLDFDEARKAEAVAKQQQELVDQADEVQKRLDELKRSAERGGTADSAFMRQLDEIRDELNRALSQELKQKLDALRDALKKLDPQATQNALKDLADAQRKLKEALERSRELFKRAAVEGELSSLEQETKQVLDQQKQWNEQVAKTDSAKSGAEEQRLAERTDSVAKGLDAAAKQMEGAERQEALQQTAEQVRKASRAMKSASQSAQSGQRSQAKQQGQQAAEQLSQAGNQVKKQREGQQQQWKKEVLDALDRALAETARLSERQLDVSGSIGRGSVVAASRAEQAVIEEGVQKLIAQIGAVSGKNALISPQIGAALAQAKLQMGQAREAISSASANLREAADQAGEAVDALNVAAYLMLRSRNDVSSASSASGMAEAIERMQQLAGQQGNLSQQGSDLLSMLAGQQMQQQMQLLAQKQQQLAQELERLRAQAEMPGAKAMADEARELARRLEAGRLDRETVARQERLFKRMLDAGRTLQGEEKDEKKERQSETAKSDSVSIPPALRRLLDSDGRIRFPTWDELQRLSPEERRLVTDYFRRLTTREKP